MKRLVITAAAIVLVGLSIFIRRTAQASPEVQQTAPTPFLLPPFFGTTRANCVFDHEYPIYEAEFQFGEAISSTVLHYDGSRASSPIVIGTSSCYSGHSGIDYGLTYQPVLAAADGTVVRSQWFSQNHQVGYGLYVRINHGASGYSTIYGHLSAVSVYSYSEESLVRAGDVIGISGNTGNSDGRHLHFETQYSTNLKVNPYGWIGPAGGDPWAVYNDGIRQGAPSYNLWQNPPRINNTNNLYPSGDEIEPRDFPPLPSAPGVVVVDDSAAQVTGALLAFAALPSGSGVSDVWLYAPADGAVSRATRNADSRYPVFISDR